MIKYGIALLVAFIAFFNVNQSFAQTEPTVMKQVITFAAATYICEIPVPKFYNDELFLEASIETGLTIPVIKDMIAGGIEARSKELIQEVVDIVKEQKLPENEEKTMIDKEIKRRCDGIRSFIDLLKPGDPV